MPREFLGNWLSRIYLFNRAARLVLVCRATGPSLCSLNLSFSDTTNVHFHWIHFGELEDFRAMGPHRKLRLAKMLWTAVAG
jgi:hypothetical protein